MPKVSLEFNLPEEHEELYNALQGPDCKYTLIEIDQWARNALKYGHQFKSADEALESLREKIRLEAEDRDISLL